ncbi:hypothetical protein N1027_01740 [Herbiconiux sp. CPCC 205763]|uniref:Uncharacterized protein n=1 Tax=Herbiconiux aconitum TaxID=2970913 RepID=A0ABT2GNH0_9MICO|nr:hypothetical protein [Herbiconiux aconitum]MCS5716850.1 hypothetical protein [Herbiconiux aconitum]
MAALIAAGALLAGIVVPLGAQSAQALPPECTTEVTWHNGTSYVKDDGTIVETGIHSTSRFVCGPTTGWEPGGDPSTGGGSTPPGPPPAPPGPELPKPPDSVPPTAAPPCVPGANNATDPGRGKANQTGNGDAIEDLVTAALATGDVKIDSTSPSKIISMDVNVGESMSGDRGVNPFEGVEANGVPNRLYWNGVDPTITEVGWALKALKTTAQQMMRAVTTGDLAANSAWRATWAKLPADKRQIVIDIVKTRIQSTQSAWKNDVPEQVKWVIEGLWEMLELAAEIPLPVSGAPDADPAQLYIAALSEPRFFGDRSNDNDGVCGQLASATVSAPSLAGLAPTGEWVHVTLTGTTHGTLVDELKALTAPAVHCPRVEVDAIAKQENLLQVTTGCSGTVTASRILTRKEVVELSYADKAILMAGSEEDPLAGTVLKYSYASSDPSHAYPNSGATSIAGVDTINFFGDSKDGTMSYTTLKPQMAEDYVVVAAKDSAGVEHPFLVKINIKSPPNCPKVDKPVGPGVDGFRAVIQDGNLQLVRNLPFTLDLKLFCTTDYRDTYRVTLENTIPGTKGTVNPDGTVTFTWTDPDVVIDKSHPEVLTVTPWDETTGAPGESWDVPVVVRDVPPSCKDVAIVYDESDLKGGPLEIPIECGMEGGLKVLSPPFLNFLVPGTDQMVQEVPGGTFVSDGKTLTFTPTGKHVALSTAQVVPWSTNPLTYTPYPVQGKAFEVDVRMED